jgi:hypothetical protein
MLPSLLFSFAWIRSLVDSVTVRLFIGSNLSALFTWALRVTLTVDYNVSRWFPTFATQRSIRYAFQQALLMKSA